MAKKKVVKKKPASKKKPAPKKKTAPGTAKKKAARKEVKKRTAAAVKGLKRAKKKAVKKEKVAIIKMLGQDFRKQDVEGVVKTVAKLKKANDNFHGVQYELRQAQNEWDNKKKDFKDRLEGLADARDDLLTELSRYADKFKIGPDLFDKPDKTKAQDKKGKNKKADDVQELIPEAQEQGKKTTKTPKADKIPASGFFTFIQAKKKVKVSKVGVIENADRFTVHFPDETLVKGHIDVAEVKGTWHFGIELTKVNDKGKVVPLISFPISTHREASKTRLNAIMKGTLAMRSVLVKYKKAIGFLKKFDSYFVKMTNDFEKNGDKGLAAAS